MKVSPISTEIVLPAHVQAEGIKGGSGRTTQEKSKAAERPAASMAEQPQNERNPSGIEPIVNGNGLGLRFYLDRDTGIRVIEVFDQESGDLIRQIPPDEVVDFMRQFENSKGHFVSRRF